MDEPYAYLSMNVTLLKAFAMYPLNHGASVLERWWYRASKYFSILFTYIMVIPVILSIFLNHQDVVQSALNVLNVGIYVSSVLTMHILQRGKGTVRDLIAEINTTFKENSEDGVTQVSMKATNRFVKLLSLYWYIAITICAQIMAFYPIYANRGTERVLAVPTWYPFNWKESPIYELMFVIQCVGQFNLTNIYGMADTLIMSILLATGKQIELLGCNFENCVYSALLKQGVPRDSVLLFSRSFNAYGNEGTDSPEEELSTADDSNWRNEKIDEAVNSSEFQEQLYELLGRYVRHHQALLNFIQKVENFLWPLMFVKITASMSYHALICFMIVFNANQTFLYTLGQYEIMALYELLLISYFGQYLINKGENLQKQVYRCPWYINNKKFQHSLLLVLNGCARPPRLSVAKLADLSLATFLAIIKTSTSYFTVLRQTVQR